MILEGELSIAKRLDFNVHSDVESVALDIPAQECTTPHKSFSIPLCVSFMQPLLKTGLLLSRVVCDIYRILCRVVLAQPSPWTT